MKTLRKTIICLLIILLSAAGPVFSQNNLKITDLNKAADTLIGELKGSIPFNSASGLNWSDAYIGQFPHFGAGISAGGTTIDYEAVSGLFELFGIDSIPHNDSAFYKGIGFPLPAYTVELRMGIPDIPLDAGLKFGLLTPEFSKNLLYNSPSKSDFGLDYLLIGADVRYSIIERKVFPLRWSVGFGVNFIKGGISASSSGNINFSDTYSGGDLRIETEKPKLETYWNSFNFEIKTQVSFPFTFITPYLGAGAGFSFSQAGYRVNSTSALAFEYNPNNEDGKKSAEERLNELGLSNDSSKGFTYIKQVSAFNLRIFTGFSINMVFVRLDITGMYNILNNDLGASIGIRYQM